jgi:hypothetical protein
LLQIHGCGRPSWGGSPNQREPSRSIMANGPSRETQLTPLARDRTIQVLSAHFASDVLDLAEFERRVDAAHRARSPRELDALLADLPSSPPVGASAEVVPAGTNAAPPSQLVPLPPRRMVVAIWAGVTRKGAWRPGARTLTFAVMGGIELDFRGVQLPPGPTDVTAIAIMGGIEIIVPPEVDVEVNGFAFMGGFDQTEHPERPPSDRPLLRVNGFALMGGVDVQTRLAGETAGDAAKRRRAERKLRRQRERGS